MPLTTLTLPVIILIALIIIGFKAFKVVPQQEAQIVERLGKYHATLAPGLNILVPFLDRVAYRHSLKEIPLDVPSQCHASRADNHCSLQWMAFCIPSNRPRTRVIRFQQTTSSPSPSLPKPPLRSVIGRMDWTKPLKSATTSTAP